MTIPDDRADRVAARVREAIAAALAVDPERAFDVRVTVRGEDVDVAVAPANVSPAPVPKQSFASWLAESLRLRGLTQEVAARRLGVSLKTVNRWVRGETEPRFRELVIVYETFGESPLPIGAPPVASPGARPGELAG